jgi:hypothetical protein
VSEFINVKVCILCVESFSLSGFTKFLKYLKLQRLSLSHIITEKKEAETLYSQALPHKYKFRGKCRVFRVQADWTLILPSANFCESAAPLAEKNAATLPELLAHIIHFFVNY